MTFQGLQWGNRPKTGVQKSIIDIWELKKQDFSGGPVVKNQTSMQGTQVWSSDGELRSHVVQLEQALHAITKTWHNQNKNK